VVSVQRVVKKSNLARKVEFESPAIEAFHCFNAHAYRECDGHKRPRNSIIGGSVAEKQQLLPMMEEVKE